MSGCRIDPGHFPEDRYPAQRQCQDRSGQINEQIIAGQFDFRHQIQLFLLEQTVEEFTGHALFIQHKDRVGQKFFKTQGLVLQIRKMLGIGNKISLNSRTWRTFEHSVHAGIGIIGHDQIHLTVIQKIHTPGAGLIGHFNVDIREMGVKFFK